MRGYRMIGWAGLAAVLALAGGCGDDGGTDPQDETVLSKPNNSGDNQTGPPGLPLGQPLRVRVTRNGEPAEDVTVVWATEDGSLSEATSLTEADGVAQMRWTLAPVPRPQSARASVVGATNSPLSFFATANIPPSGPPPPEPVVIRVQGPPADQFSPASVQIQPGQTVIWVWDTDATGHNLTPAAAVPAPESGTALFSAPHSYSYTFTQPGTYRYYCSAHGGPDGSGMSGEVIVALDK